MKKYNQTGFRVKVIKQTSAKGHAEEIMEGLLIGQLIIVNFEDSCKVGEVTQKTKSCVFVRIENRIECITKSDIIQGIVKIESKPLL